MLQASPNFGCPGRPLWLVITCHLVTAKSQSVDPARLVLECRLLPCPSALGGGQVSQVLRLGMLRKRSWFEVEFGIQGALRLLYEKVSSLQQYTPGPSLGYPQTHQFVNTQDTSCFGFKKLQKGAESFEEWSRRLLLQSITLDKTLQQGWIRPNL